MHTQFLCEKTTVCPTDNMLFIVGVAGLGLGERSHHGHNQGSDYDRSNTGRNQGKALLNGML